MSFAPNVGNGDGSDTIDRYGVSGREEYVPPKLCKAPLGLFITPAASFTDFRAAHTPDAIEEHFMDILFLRMGFQRSEAVLRDFYRGMQTVSVGVLQTNPRLLDKKKLLSMLESVPYSESQMVFAYLKQLAWVVGAFELRQRQSGRDLHLDLVSETREYLLGTLEVEGRTGYHSWKDSHERLYGLVVLTAVARMLTEACPPKFLRGVLNAWDAHINTVGSYKMTGRSSTPY